MGAQVMELSGGVGYRVLQVQVAWISPSHTHVRKRKWADVEGATAQGEKGPGRVECQMEGSRVWVP